MSLTLGKDVPARARGERLVRIAVSRVFIHLSRTGIWNISFLFCDYGTAGL